jgi:hypothetical protein
MIKVRGDKHGPAGQWVRVLLRQATTADILLEKPTVPLQPKGHIFDRYIYTCPCLCNTGSTRVIVRSTVMLSICGYVTVAALKEVLEVLWCCLNVEVLWCCLNVYRVTIAAVVKCIYSTAR